MCTHARTHTLPGEYYSSRAAYSSLWIRLTILMVSRYYNTALRWECSSSLNLLTKMPFFLFLIKSYDIYFYVLYMEKKTSIIPLCCSLHWEMSPPSPKTLISIYINFILNNIFCGCILNWIGVGNYTIRGFCFSLWLLISPFLPLSLQLYSLCSVIEPQLSWTLAIIHHWSNQWFDPQQTASPDKPVRDTIFWPP